MKNKKLSRMESAVTRTKEQTLNLKNSNIQPQIASSNDFKLNINKLQTHITIPQSRNQRIA